MRVDECTVECGKWLIVEELKALLIQYIDLSSLWQSALRWGSKVRFPSRYSSKSLYAHVCHLCSASELAGVECTVPNCFFFNFICDQMLEGAHWQLSGQAVGLSLQLRGQLSAIRVNTRRRDEYVKMCKNLDLLRAV